MFVRLLNLIFGSKNERELKKFQSVIDHINSLEGPLEALSSDGILQRSESFKKRLAAGETLDDALPEAFALCREVSKRVLGLRHFDVQMLGGIVLNLGKISEMKTGEGKTLVATLPIYLNALTGKGVHLVTVNDYLAKRDSQWMAPLYLALGCSVGVIQHESSFYMTLSMMRRINACNIFGPAPEGKPITRILPMAPIMSLVLITCAIIWL